MVLQPGRDDVEVPGQVWIWELCVGESQTSRRKKKYRAASEPRTNWDDLGRTVSHLVSLLSPQATQGQVEQL